MDDFSLSRRMMELFLMERAQTQTPWTMGWQVPLPFFNSNISHNKLHPLFDIQSKFCGCSLFSCDVSVRVRETGGPSRHHAGASLSVWTDPPHQPWTVSAWGEGLTRSEWGRHSLPPKTVGRPPFRRHHLTKQHRLKTKHSPRTILPIERKKPRFQTWKRKMSHFYLDRGVVHCGNCLLWVEILKALSSLSITVPIF